MCMKGLNSRLFRTRSARLNILWPVTCSVSNVSRIGRRERCPCGLRAGGSQNAQIFLQHLNVIFGSPGSIVLGRRWHVEGYVAMMTFQNPGWATHPDGHVVILAVVRISARRSNKIIFKSRHSVCHASWIITSETRKRAILTTHVRASNSPFRCIYE